MPKLKSLIVDDDKISRDFVEHLVEKHCPEVSIIAKCSSAEQAKHEIESNEIDLLFLDIQMPHETGFDLLNHFSEKNFQVVFITAYEKYAFKAFKTNALDYLLKPIDKEKIIASVKKAVNSYEINHKTNELNTHFDSADSHDSFNTLLLPGKRGAVTVKFEDICYLEASNNYSIIHTKNGDEFVASKTLKEFDSILNNDFLRVHKSYLVNKHCIVGYTRLNGVKIKLEKGEIIPVSRRKQGLFLNQYNSN